MKLAALLLLLTLPALAGQITDPKLIPMPNRSTDYPPLPPGCPPFPPAPVKPVAHPYAPVLANNTNQ